MSDTTTAHRVRNLRRWRVVFAALVAFEVTHAAFEAIEGSALIVVPLFMTVLLTLQICWQTVTIRRLQREARQPDYLLIAAMECEIYGEAFKHDGSPYLGDFHPSDFPPQW